MNAPDLADVLAEVNRLRAERGMDPLDAMPKGNRDSAFHCPVARAFRDVDSQSSASESSIWIGTGGQAGRIPTPLVIREFIEAFDSGEYPELRA